MRDVGGTIEIFNEGQSTINNKYLYLKVFIIMCISIVSFFAPVDICSSLLLLFYVKVDLNQMLKKTQKHIFLYLLLMIMFL